MEDQLQVMYNSEINKKFYKIVIVDGVGFKTLINFQRANTHILQNYKGTDKIFSSCRYWCFEIKSVEYNVILNAPDVKMIYHDGTRFIATLTDKQEILLGMLQLK